MRGRRTAAAALALLLAATAACTGEPEEPGREVTVMTRNVYLGADITRPIRAVQDLGGEDRTGQAALVVLGQATAELRAMVDRTDFRVRSRLLAAEIAAAEPHLVGLQEVALWRRGPLDLARPGVPDAEQVDLDFLAILLGDLAARGAPYEVAVVQQGSDVEAPAFTGPDPRSAPDAHDVRLTVRDVVLVRRGADVRVEDRGGAQYRARLDLDVAGVPVSLVRGHAWVDVEAAGVPLRFVTTHLESQSGDLAAAQAAELAQDPVTTERPTVLVGDLNSDPADPSVRRGDRLPASTAARRLTDAGFGGVASGPTGTLGEPLDDRDADALRRRIDHVLVRGPVSVGQVRRVGHQVRDRDPATGLWPSDHAGVVAELRAD